MGLDPKDYSAVTKVRGGRAYPDLVNSPALKNLPRETAEAEGWPTYFMPSACRYGHTSARFVKNDMCTDCWRTRQTPAREPLYPKSKDRTFYAERKAGPAVGASGAPVIVAPPAPPEPTKAEQSFLAALDELRDFDAAAERVGWARGLVEARASSNEVFRKALSDLCSRRDIPWTRAADTDSFAWTPEIERQFARRFVDCGLLEQTRQELGVSASNYQAHLRESRAFASLIGEALPLARETLRERAMQAASIGNDRLAKLLEDDLQEGVFTDVMGRKHHHFDPAAAREELARILADVDKRLRQQEALENIAAQRAVGTAAPAPENPSENSSNADLTT